MTLFWTDASVLVMFRGGGVYSVSMSVGVVSSADKISSFDVLSVIFPGGDVICSVGLMFVLFTALLLRPETNVYELQTYFYK